MKILIVEDDVDSGEALMLLLLDIGYEVKLVLNPLRAAAVAREFRPHVGILDIGLPNMSGYELVEQLRSLQELDGCRYISVSAYCGSEVGKRSLQAGFEYHLTKPLAVSHLLELLAGAVCANRLQSDSNAGPNGLAPALQQVAACNR